jgi:DNA-binding response OmpR family regulator
MTLRILSIDDDPAMTELLSLLLKTHGYEPLVANTSTDGLRKIREESPDAVILDLMMPDMDGWQVCAEVRKFSTIPIIILSALDNPGLVASALDAGADDYLVKPVPTGTLLSSLTQLTRRTDMNGGIKLSTHAASSPA